MIMSGCHLEDCDWETRHTEVDEQYRYLGLLLKLKIPLLLFRSVRGGRKERGKTVGK